MNFVETLLIPITETGLDLVQDTVQAQNGYIGLSAYRSADAELGREATPQEKEAQKQVNFANDRELQKILRTGSYSFLPIHGGYVEKDATKNVNVEVTEPSYFVFGTDRNGKPTDMEKLKDFGVQLARKFNQDYILFKPGGSDENVYFVDKTGQKVGSMSGKKINDPSQEYYTKLRTSNPAIGKPGRTLPTDKRFSWMEGQVFTQPAFFFIRKAATSVNEATMRGRELSISVPDEYRPLRDKTFAEKLIGS